MSIISEKQPTENWDNERPSTSQTGLYEVLNSDVVDNLSPLAYHQILGADSKSLKFADARLPEPPAEPKWVRAMHGYVPKDAFADAGHDMDKYSGQKLNMYVSKAMHEGHMLPGKLAPARACSYVCFNGFEYQKDLDCEVLCGQNFAWLSTSANEPPPPNAVPGGWTSDQPPEKLFIGRAECNNAQVIGKVHYSQKKCYIPYDGLEFGFPTFKILVTITTN